LGAIINADPTASRLNCRETISHCDFRPSQNEVELFKDKEATMYLTPTLEVLKAACGGMGLGVLTVASDGSCLPHAVSRALVGQEIFYDALRLDLMHELRDNAPWYERILNRDEQGNVVLDDETWTEHWLGIVSASAPTFGNVVGQDRWLEQPHILGYFVPSFFRPLMH
jgi:hypothetical protein